MARTLKAERISATQAEIADALQPHAKDVLERISTLAKCGDPVALGLWMRYYAPAPTAPERTIDLPEMAAQTTLTGKVGAVLDAVARGKIGPATAEALMKSLEVLGKAIAIEDFNARLAALEKATQARNGGVLPVAPRVPDEPLPLA